jgi:hypothetical protein
VRVVDDVLLAPVNGLMWVFRKIDRAAREELETRGERLKKDLSDLYMQLETGRISEQDFDAREKQILDQLDSLKKTKTERAGGGQAAQPRAPSTPPASGPPASAPARADATPPGPSAAPPAPSPDPGHEPSPAPEVPATADRRWWVWAAAGAVLAGVVGAAFWRSRKRPDEAPPAASPGGDAEAVG